MSKKDMKPIEIGNVVTLPIRKAGNAVTLAEYIAHKVEEWQTANPGKRIIDTPIPDVVTPTRQRKGYVNSVKFSIEVISEDIIHNPIIKEVCQLDDGSYRIVLRTDDYNKSLSKFIALMNIAKTDFPGLKDTDPEIVVYGGDRRKRIPGLEFDQPKGSHIPDCYKKISSLEPTL